jgi:glycosyltransferase involved in cell wall biosynthesis
MGFQIKRRINRHRTDHDRSRQACHTNLVDTDNLSMPGSDQSPLHCFPREFHSNIVDDMRISIVLPALNEAANVPDLLARIQAAMTARNWDYEVIIVDDGSTDGTSQAAQSAGAGIPLTIIRHPANRGYGAALRSGFGRASKDWVFLTDSDGQFDIEQINRLAERKENADFIIGFREHRQDHGGRLVNAWVFNRIVRILFGLQVRDIDCAFKLMRREALQRLPLEASGALISTELLIRAKQHHYRIVEVGVSHFPRLHGTPTGARLSVIFRAIRELFLLRLTGHIKLT